MKKRFIIIALSLLSLNAHAQKYNYDVNNDGQVTVSDIMLIVNKILGKENDEPKYPITVNVSEEPIFDPDATASSMRRTPETFMSNLNQFYVNYTYIDENYNEGMIGQPELPTIKVNDDYTGEGRWLVGNEKEPGYGTWPQETGGTAIQTNFYAYANVDMTNWSINNDENIWFTNTYSTDPSLHFLLDENTSETKDLLVAKNADNWNNCHGEVYFHFTHACAAVKFFVSKTAKLKDVTIKVQKVYLYNVKNEGYYYFESNRWDNVGFKDTDATSNDGVKYTLWDGSSFTDVSLVTNDNPYPWQLTTSTNPDQDYFFFIPQSFGPKLPEGGFYPVTEQTTFPYIKLLCTIAGKNSSGGDMSYGTEDAPVEAYIPFTIGSIGMGNAYKSIISIGTGLRDKNGRRYFDTNGHVNANN